MVLESRSLMYRAGRQKAVSGAVADPARILADVSCRMQEGCHPGSQSVRSLAFHSPVRPRGAAERL